MSENSALFSYCFDLKDTKQSYVIPISNNYEGTINELVHLITSQYNIPVYLETNLKNKVENFIVGNREIDYNNEVDKLIDDYKYKENDVEDMTKQWEKRLREETAEYGERKCASDEELFATAYHKLVHSPALETMLQLEHVYSQTVREKTEAKNKKIKTLSEQQTEEMNKAVDALDITMTEYNINELALRHFEDQSLMRVELASELDTIKEAQRREYREWLMQMLEQNQANSSLPSPKSPLSCAPFRGNRITDIANSLPVPGLEESFTIHLGSQLKQMHNIRIMSANVMDLCTLNHSVESWKLEPTPQLLQTALALYSNDLCGLVLMTDNVVSCMQTKEFVKVCERSTEFHFPHIEDQLEKISSSVAASRSNGKHLNPGDLYITRHSNLAQVHVIFHMVIDDSIRGHDINSRHAVLLGLRNILKCACANDITSLTIPLLLQYEMTEEMTVSWCTKRAELVFKCVKGFMIEMASWGGSDLKNLQFLVPEGISSDVFLSLTTMLPSIFKVSNPLVLKSTNSNK